jgi:hypothetical protein
LKSGGEIGAYFPVHFPMYTVIDALSKDPIWSEYHEVKPLYIQ